LAEDRDANFSYPNDFLHALSCDLATVIVTINWNNTIFRCVRKIVLLKRKRRQLRHQRQLEGPDKRLPLSVWDLIL